MVYDRSCLLTYPKEVGHQHPKLLHTRDHYTPGVVLRLPNFGMLTYHDQSNNFRGKLFFLFLWIYSMDTRINQ